MLATITRGQRSGSRSRPPQHSRRRPIVSTDGLSRSNGNVSHAGSTTDVTGWPTNWARSSASWPAIVPVGVATSSGRRCDSRARAAMATGRAISLIASRAPGRRGRASAPARRAAAGGDQPVARGRPGYRDVDLTSSEAACETRFVSHGALESAGGYSSWRRAGWRASRRRAASRSTSRRRSTGWHCGHHTVTRRHGLSRSSWPSSTVPHNGQGRPRRP